MTARAGHELAVTFDCEGERLVGIVAVPAAPVTKRGVLIIVGGPQYRVGSHRQFLLLARCLADQGVPCMRFDYRGMGDSSGELRNFEGVSADIRSAVDCFVQHARDVREVVLWGLCDAASAAVFYAASDPRITGLVLLNPWVRSEAGEAKAYLKHYYLARVLDKSLWRRMLTGRFDFRRSFASLVRFVESAVSANVLTSSGSRDHAIGEESLPDRMAHQLGRFSGRVMLILSGNDLTAREFIDAANSPRWRRLLARQGVSRIDLQNANHTFSTREWRDIVSRQTCNWVLER
jgi:exosortase A-associated hydrolase 1